LHSATGYIYTYSLMEPQSHALEMQKEMIAEIEADRPEFCGIGQCADVVGQIAGLRDADFFLRERVPAPSVPKGGNGGYEPAVRVHLGIRRPSISAAFAIVYRRFQKKTECGLVLSDP
jgi:hypothetical protein